MLPWATCRHLLFQVDQVISVLTAAVEGRGYAWGSNVVGQLGLGDFAQRLVPTAVPSLVNIRSVTCRGSCESVFWLSRDCAFDDFKPAENGSLFVCGANPNGLLGVGDSIARTSIALALSSLPVSRLSVGINHAIALTQNGSILAWGSTTFSAFGFYESSSVQTPTILSLGLQGAVQDVVAADFASFLISLLIVASLIM